MKLSSGIIFLLFLINGFSVSVQAATIDSLRMERRSDGVVVIHRVDASETLYSLSKRYGADLVDIAGRNKLDGYSIDVGQILEIPYVEKKKEEGDKKRIIHIVKPKETLFAISHIYGVNIYDIKTWNKLDSDNLKEGQELIVSAVNETKVSPAINKTAEPVNTANLNSHVVKKGETLYAISKKYDVSQKELMKINNLSDNNISINQVLIIKNGAGAKNISDQKIVKTPKTKDSLNDESAKDAVQLQDDTVQKTNPKIVANVVDTTDLTKKVIDTGSQQTQNEDNQFEKVFEEGVAMEIENSPNTKKYLCLHRSLPVGTIVQVKNLMNSRTIFVRVVGNLPEIGNNENVLIRLSSVAYKRLGAIDSRFPIELSYIPD